MDKLLETAIEKMSKALQTYKDKQIDQAIELKKEADLLFDDYNNKVDKCLVKDKCLYGENINFGVINHVFNQNIKNNIHENSENKPYTKTVDLKKYAKRIRTTPNLLAQYNIYDKLTSKEPNDNYSSYVDVVMGNYHSGIDACCVENDNRTLINDIREMGCDELIDIDENLHLLYMLIGNIIFTYNNPDKYDEYVDTKEKLKEILYLLDQDKCNSEEYDEDLNQEELALLNDLNNLDDYEQEERFNNDKEILLNDIKDRLTITTDDEETIEWKKIFNRIKDKEYDKETFIESISDFYSIGSILNENK